MNLTELVSKQNTKLINSNSIYRLNLVDNQVELLDTNGNPTNGDDDRFLTINQESDLTDYIDNLIDAEQSYYY